MRPWGRGASSATTPGAEVDLVNRIYRDPLQSDTFGALDGEGDLGDGSGGDGVGAESFVVGEFEAEGAVGGVSIFAPGFAFAGGAEDLAGFAVGGGGIGLDVDEEEEIVLGAEFEGWELPAAPAALAGGAAGDEAGRPSLDVNLGPQRESCEEGEVPQKINFMLYWNSRPRTSGFCTKERPN